MDSAIVQEDPARLLDKLLGAIRKRGRLLTAFSGGVDSTLVTAVARRALGRASAPAALGDSASLARFELEEARRIAKELDVELFELNPGEQDDPNYRRNDPDRCYFCKTHLYEQLRELAARLNIRHIANGTNTDDLGDHRPGMKAAKEVGVITPLVEAGLGKPQVRAVAEHLGLPNWDKPAAACLASRLPYGTSVTLGRLEQIERAEAALRKLGFSGCRVRHHEKVARIELPIDQMQRLWYLRPQVVEVLKQAGYLYITVDLEGFRSGSANIALTSRGS